jgi:predicted P-loop ATPase
MNEIAELINTADDFDRNDKGQIFPNSQKNIRRALQLANVGLRHNIFANRLLLSVDDGPEQLLDDAALDDLWLMVDGRWKFRPAKDFFVTVVCSVARKNCFHPVQEYLAGLQWDRIPRLDTWLVRYGGAEDTPYVRAVGALTLVAACRRVRQPGVKFDEMPVFEGRQGVGKSQALRSLGPNPDWFSDDLPLDVDAKQVIERTSGKWIMEASELSGLSPRSVEHLKAFLSR